MKTLNSIKHTMYLVMMSAIVVVGLLLVILVGIEVIGRATGLLAPPGSMLRLSATKGYELDPAKPNINSHGLRNREFPLQKPEHTFRIVTLGDSFTYGLGLKSEETYVKQLEALLNTQRDAHETRYEVLNAGVPGYNTHQEFIHLQEVGMPFNPDLILVGFVLNDAEIGYFGLKTMSGEDWRMKAKRWMKENVALYSDY